MGGNTRTLSTHFEPLFSWLGFSSFRWILTVLQCAFKKGKEKEETKRKGKKMLRSSRARGGTVPTRSIAVFVAAPASQRRASTGGAAPLVFSFSFIFAAAGCDSRT